MDTGGNTNATTTTKGIVEQATSAEIIARSSTGGTGAPLFINTGDIQYLAKFGGTGADGALTVTSGTTTIDLTGLAVVVKNYTAISITGTGSVAFSNPHANGSIVILKSQGVVTLTSSTAPMITTVGVGATAGSGGSGNGVSGTTSFTWDDRVVNFGVGGSSDDGGGGGGSYYNAGVTGGGGSPGAGGVAVTTLVHATQFRPFFKVLKLWSGAGGGEGGETSGAAGAGGRGGGGLYIECGGAFNFTTASGISVAGAVGSNAASGNSGGGGGGGGASCIILYNSLTANSGTITVAGGAGGTLSGTGSAGGAGGDGNSFVGANGDFF